MSLNNDFLNMLVCPKCHGSITLFDQGQGILCSSCKLVYPIREDIPILLIEKALPENEWDKKEL